MRPKDIEKGLTADRLCEVLRYEPKTGKFFWLKANNQKKMGDVAGMSDAKHGYVRITIFGDRYLGHRLAWLYMTGEWPSNRIDHRNLTRSDNRWENLRQANDSENKGNQKKQKNNTTGVKGVSLHKKTGKYTAKIGRGGMYLGLFDTIEAAKAAYEAKAKELFGEFARVDS